MSAYIVKSGDSLSTIAQNVLGHASAWPQIAALNNIKAPYTIYVGQHLALPDPNAPAPSPTPQAPAPAPGTQPAQGGGGVFARLVGWAKANPGQATFWGLSLTLSAAGLYLMATGHLPFAGDRKRAR